MRYPRNSNGSSGHRRHRVFCLLTGSFRVSISCSTKVPKNLTIILLPSRSPELNPVENIWQYLRQNWLSNRVFEDYDAIIEAGCQAWNKLIDQPETIMSIGMRDWAISGQ